MEKSFVLKSLLQNIKFLKDLVSVGTLFTTWNPLQLWTMFQLFCVWGRGFISPICVFGVSSFVCACYFSMCDFVSLIVLGTDVYIVARCNIIDNWEGEILKKLTSKLCNCCWQGIPRTVWLDSSTKSSIITLPVDEVKSLRHNKVSKKEIQLAPGTVVQVDGVIGDQVIPHWFEAQQLKYPLWAIPQRIALTCDSLFIHSFIFFHTKSL